MEEKTLVCRVTAGEEEAMRLLVETYRPGLTRFLCRYVPPEDAEEIALDVFAAFLLHPKRYDGRASLKTYLYMMGRSRALTLLRRRRLTLPLEETWEAEEDAIGASLLRSERRRTLSEAMATLPKRQREALTLVYLEDLSYREAAQVLHCREKQVDNLLTRAKATLRAVIGEEGRELL